MKLLYDNDAAIDELQDQIKQQIMGDYIYMYPPRQSYAALKADQAMDMAHASLDLFPSLNLYFHVPFCNQICSFCNLYARVSKDKTEYSRYVQLMIDEIQLFYTSKILDKKINTLYLGGGTPSLLSPGDFAVLFDYLKKELDINVFEIEEVSLEVAPDTVDLAKFKELQAIGINRVNLGFQAANAAELQSIGRRHGVYVLEKAMLTIKEIGFSNTCIDLIYGLQNQSPEDWIASVQFVITYRPETICIYPLTLRPATIYNKKGYLNINGAQQYYKYEAAVDALLTAGYRQETHIRFSLPNGGYIQKENHWKLENVLGIGAGARSYLWNIDTRNHYSALKRDDAYKQYVGNILSKEIPISDGFLMTNAERQRKALILGLVNLSRSWFKELFGQDVLELFPLLFPLAEQGFINVSDLSVSLTAKGLKYRDLIVQLFFSSEVNHSVCNYDYKD